MALALVVDAELFRIEAAVRWLDSADGPPRTGVAVAGRRLRRRHVAPRRPVGRLGARP